MLDEVTAELRTRCGEAGFDIVHPFRIEWFNDTAPASLRLPDFGRPGGLGIVIGNSRRLWSSLRAALQADVSLCDVEHPLDTYVETTLTRAAAQSLASRHVILFAHRTEPAPIPIQRIAHESGLAHLSPSRLSIHPEHGPWWSLRAVVVADMDGPVGDPPRAADLCTPCAKPCLAAFERALAATDMARPGDVEHNWRAWALVRDVCPEGRASRFGDDQLRYHYTKDRSILKLLAR